MSALQSPVAVRRPLLYREPPPGMPCPNRLNVFLVVLVFSLAVLLFWFGSRAETWSGRLAVGVVFSYLMLTNYALFHEAAHGNLHSNPPLNYVLGILAGMLFPMPFSMMCVTHRGHHLRNRTDHEMFDLYYPTDNRFIRFVQWYGILCGFFWPFVPLVRGAVCDLPGRAADPHFPPARLSNYLLGDVRG